MSSSTISLATTTGTPSKGTDERREAAESPYFKQDWQDWVRRHTPLDTLPPKYSLEHSMNAPSLFYGYSVTQAWMLSFASEHSMYDPDRPNEPLNRRTCRGPIMEYLQDITGADLTWECGLSEHLDERIIALYSNYTMKHKQYRDEDEQDVIRLLQRELCTEEQPKWYWDFNNPS